MNWFAQEAFRKPEGFRNKPCKKSGAEGDRTPGLDIANVALSQLSYSPSKNSMRKYTVRLNLSRTDSHLIILSLFSFFLHESSIDDIQIKM